MLEEKKNTESIKKNGNIQMTANIPEKEIEMASKQENRFKLLVMKESQKHNKISFHTLQGGKNSKS